MNEADLVEMGFTPCCSFTFSVAWCVAQEVRRAWSNQLTAGGARDVFLNGAVAGAISHGGCKVHCASRRFSGAAVLRGFN